MELPERVSISETGAPIISSAIRNGRATQELLKSLQLRGFVIIELSSSEESVIKEAHRQSVEFFAHPSLDGTSFWPLPLMLAEKRRLQLIYDCGNGGRGLLGWNAPHLAKEVFRLRRGVQHASPLSQPPAHALFDSSLAAHDLLQDLCTRIVTSALDMTGTDAARFLDEHTDLRSDNGTYSTSPFDFFYYNNSTAFPHLENCSAHIDPGLLTLVPLSPSPGLALLHPRTSEWLAIEECDLQPLRHVVAFTGHTLQALAATKSSSTSTEPSSLPGVVHCVYKGSVPRYSMVYELRTVHQIHQRPPSSFAARVAS